MSPCQSRWCAATFSTTAASGAHRLAPVQLEAGQLDGQDRVRVRLADRVDHGEARRCPRRRCGARPRRAWPRASARSWSCRWCRSPPASPAATRRRAPGAAARPARRRRSPGSPRRPPRPAAGCLAASPGVVITSSVPSGSRGSGLSSDRDAEVGEFLGDPAVALVVAAVDGGDPRAAGRERPGHRRAGDAEPVDAHQEPAEPAEEAVKPRVRSPPQPDSCARHHPGSHST